MLAKTAISTGTCTSALHRHRALAERYSKSEARIAKAREAFAGYDLIKNQPLAVFCAGSMARMEIGAKSDLDLFVTADRDSDSSSVSRRLFQIKLFSEMIGINGRLEYPPPSNDGEYLKISFMDDLTSGTGSRLDDSENLFTTRMLLILGLQLAAEPQERSNFLDCTFSGNMA
jgi:predicted nucleotidyltransferase